METPRLLVSAPSATRKHKQKQKHKNETALAADKRTPTAVLLDNGWVLGNRLAKVTNSLLFKLHLCLAAWVQ